MKDVGWMNEPHVIRCRGMLTTAMYLESGE